MSIPSEKQQKGPPGRLLSQNRKELKYKEECKASQGGTGWSDCRCRNFSVFWRNYVCWKRGTLTLVASLTSAWSLLNKKIYLKFYLNRNSSKDNILPDKERNVTGDKSPIFFLQNKIANYFLKKGPFIKRTCKFFTYIYKLMQFMLIFIARSLLIVCIKYA